MDTKIPFTGADPGFEVRRALIELNGMKGKAKILWGETCGKNSFSYRFRGGVRPARQSLDPRLTNVVRFHASSCVLFLIFLEI